MKFTIPVNRFKTKGGEKLTGDDVEFGAAMNKYLAQFGCAAWTCGQVLDVLMSMGFRNPERNFKRCIQIFTDAIANLKSGGTRKTRRRFPAWSEVLQIAVDCGWHREPGKPPAK